MRHAKLLFSAFLVVHLLASFPLLALDFKENRRAKYNFNSEWLLHTGDLPGAEQVRFNDRSWEMVTLPGAYNEDEAFRVAIDEHTGGIVWYRKYFRLPGKESGKKIFLEFEGIRFGGEFYVNGQKIGIHENGVMAFGFDITDYVNFGGKENVIAVRIDNSWDYKESATNTRYQWNDKNFNANYGGIPKNVYLRVTDKLYQTLPLYTNLQTTGTYIYARQIHIAEASATIHTESEVRNEYSTEQEFRFEVQIEDMDGKIVKKIDGPATRLRPCETQTVKAQGKMENIHFWSWGYGYLYNVYTTLYVNDKPVDVVKTRTGFRKTAFRDGMVYLNDRVIQLKGYT